MNNTKQERMVNITINKVAQHLKKGNTNPFPMVKDVVDSLVNMYGNITEDEKILVCETIAQQIKSYQEAN